MDIKHNARQIGQYIAPFCVAVFLCVGFFLRIRGIVDNHSFWSDEAYISSIARAVSMGNISLLDGLKSAGVTYQPLFMLMLSAFFKLFGSTEFSARLPSVLFGTVAIFLVYYITVRLSSRAGGIISAFMYASSQLVLANATQAKPYTAVTCTLLAMIAIFINIKRHDKNTYWQHALIILLAVCTTLLHSLGILSFALYGYFLIAIYARDIRHLAKKPLLAVAIACLLLALSIFLGVPEMVRSLLIPDGKLVFFTENNIMYLRELLWRNYGFVLLPSLFGFIVGYKKNPKVVGAIMTWSILLIGLWTFRHFHNIRYILPFFAVMFIFFGVFWDSVTKQCMGKQQWVGILIIIVLLYTGGYKFVRKASSYYNPNADLVGDVQIADNKGLYTQLLAKYPNLDSYVIINDNPDAQLWYLKGRAPDALFIKNTVLKIPYGQTAINPSTNKTTYTSLAQFKNLISTHKRGVVILEDWISYWPDDTKEYIKNTLKKEFEVDGLTEPGADPWPLAVYSWGL